MKVIVKDPGERLGHYAEVENELTKIQTLVGGFIETVTLSKTAVLICDEEGYIKNRKFNCYINNGFSHFTLLGTVVVVGVDGDEFTDCEMTLEEWGRMIDSEEQDFD